METFVAPVDLLVLDELTCLGPPSVPSALSNPKALDGLRSLDDGAWLSDRKGKGLALGSLPSLPNGGIGCDTNTL